MNTTVAPATPNSEIDIQIIANKQLRRHFDAGLQELKGLPSSRERSLCTTKIQEAIMWLGMDLKRLSGLRGDTAVAKSVAQLAEEAYNRYGAVTDHKNFQGNPMPEFSALPEKIQKAWEAAVAPIDDGRPYPSSYDPKSTKVEPTAENLKL